LEEGVEMKEKISLNVEEMEYVNKAIRCINYMLEAIVEKDYETARLEAKEFEYILEKLQAIEAKKARRAELERLIVEMKNRGINIDFAARASS
jgi:GH35 family endo-1,4-beta-xylanase